MPHVAAGATERRLLLSDVGCNVVVRAGLPHRNDRRAFPRRACRYGSIRRVLIESAHELLVLYRVLIGSADDGFYRQDRQTDNTTTTVPPATTKAPSPPTSKPKSKGISLGRQASTILTSPQSRVLMPG